MIDLKNLMSGIAVVIDDALENTATDEDSKTGNSDLVCKIVERFEQQ